MDEAQRNPETIPEIADMVCERARAPVWAYPSKTDKAIKRRKRSIDDTVSDSCKFARTIVSEASLPQIGKFQPPDFIKDCGEGPSAKGKSAGKPTGSNIKPTPALQCAGRSEIGAKHRP